MKKDILYEAACFYRDNLENKRFRITAGKKGVLSQIDVVFLAENFYHLMGMHKLKDLSAVVKANRTAFYINVLNGEVKYTDICDSRYKSNTISRLKNHKEMLNILKSKEVLLKSLHGCFSGVNADYLMTVQIPTSKRGHLFFAKRDAVSMPCSFFVLPDNIDKYIKDGTSLKVLNVEEITNEAREELKSKNTPSTSTPAAKVPATVGAAVSQPTDAASASSTPQSNNADLQPNPTTAQPAVSAAASSMFGNMPTVQAQNPQSIHTKQKKNDNISE
ncbi:MAG: hypothetical protein J6A83_08975 [Clostridia bacterium]|nr:hypothetical protein [Clostridia bacterium]